MTLETIDYSVVDGVAWIRMNRPHVLNALNVQMYGDLRTATRMADVDPEVEVAVIAGSGRAFATGGDLSEVLACLDEGPEGLGIYDFEDALPFSTIRRCKKPTIAAINGLCYAGGILVAASCDIAIAAPDAEFCVPEARVGIAEPFMAYAFWGRVSLAKATYYILTGRPFSAETAERIGLLTELADESGLEARVDAVVSELRRTSPNAKKMYKEFLARLVPDADLRGLQDGMRHREGIEGLRAFAEKRPPQFREGSGNL